MTDKQMMSQTLKERYHNHIVKTLMEEFKISNIMAVPKVTKVVVNTGIAKSDTSTKDIETASQELATITGQKPSIRNAKKSIAGFKIRAGDPVGVAVTLRGKRMFDFLDKLCRIVLPQVKDFRGVKNSSFDNSGNYTFGLTEQVIFPEIDYAKIERVRGLEISIVTNTQDTKQSYRLLQLIGMPFAKEE
jgi:large subunit ribosomal protein L5